VDCDVYSYGMLTLELTKVDLWPLKQSKEVKSSVKSLAELLQIFGIYLIGRPGEHDECGGGRYTQEVDRILKETLDPTLESHIIHMEIRNRVTKLSHAKAPSKDPHCVRCSTSHSTVQDCPPNPRKRSAE